ncbi:MAG TPA: LytR C-terminal domain-containing protein [Jatrophihabitantaceae bacterium]|nr:LytR C-terminal domain-containing protein [Jatrophihabitantaceae bacterium]
MERVSARRPLPALIFLLGLSLLTALVWWRVIHRSDSGSPKAATTCQSTSSKVVPQPSGVSVNVLNSTDRLHLARTVATAMGKVGFHVTGYGNDDPNVVVNGVAEIRYGTKGAQSATLLSFYLPGATLVPTTRTDSQVVVALGTKFKAVATTAQAKKTMASQKVTQLPAKAGHLAATPTPTPTATKSC